jgi:hypothetical protein
MTLIRPTDARILPKLLHALLNVQIIVSDHPMRFLAFVARIRFRNVVLRDKHKLIGPSFVVDASYAQLRETSEIARQKSSSQRIERDNKAQFHSIGNV